MADLHTAVVGTRTPLAGGDEYEKYTASRNQRRLVLPFTLFVISLLLFTLYGSAKFPLITVGGVQLSAPPHQRHSHARALRDVARQGDRFDV